MSIEGNEESCERSTATSLIRAKRKTSVVWDYFIRLKPNSIDGKYEVQCMICKKKFAMGPTFGTTNLKRHLEKHNPDKAKEGQNEPIDQKTYREKMSLAICRHNYAFSFVEHKGIRDIHSYLNPIARHISRNTAKSDILNLYAREKELLKAELALISSRVCLTSDMWTSLVSNGYMCVTAHYVNINWVLQKRVLIFRHVPPPHSGVVLGHFLIDFLKEWGIEKKIFALTLDNATCNKGVVDVLKNHLSLMRSLVCEGKFLHVRCGNHILNLIVKAGLAKVDAAIGKIREGVKYIKNSEVRLEKFAECLSNLGLPCSKKLRQDVPIRWNSTYQMIESALLYQQAYIHYDLVDPDFRHGLFEDEWKKVEIVATFLRPFYDITTLFSGCKYPTANLYLPNIWRIEMLLVEHKRSKDPMMTEMATSMLKKFKKYWESYNIILSIAMVLDPRYKLNFVKFCFSKLNSDSADQKVKVIEDNLKLLFEEYLIPSTTTSLSTSLPEEHACSSRNQMTEAFEEFDMFQSQLESSTSKTQLELYLEEANVDRKTNPNLDVLGFWKDNKLRYPELSLMGRDVLSVPITTVASESAFSTGGRVIGKFQSSILPANAEAKLCTRDWICGQEDLDGFKSDSDEDEIVVDLQPYVDKLRDHHISKDNPQ
ncbi:hypothetical protein AABB24_023960 [Solanum stoloniferum]|uniref:BED-type domain-containing protein n=1 Tax=Solanum stoloniferum TaxID=62892 RepID=A0ABD2SLN8_9SOLN